MIALVTALKPGDRFLPFLADLTAAAPDWTIVVVDDGSGKPYSGIFGEAERLGYIVLRHATNAGKGAALKTGLGHIREHRRGDGVVCADPDGQHSVADILAVASAIDHDRITLGVRRFEGRVPLRSRIGNTVTRRLFERLTGQDIQDTQTGLRGYPPDLLRWLLAIPGERFDYEMNILLYATRDGVPIDQIPVETAYLDDNASSRFAAIPDAARVYRSMLRWWFASLFSPRTRTPAGSAEQ